LPECMQLLMRASGQDMHDEMDLVVEKLCLLLKGFVMLMNGNDFSCIAEAFNIKPELVQGLLCMVRGDLQGGMALARTLGNFDEAQMHKILKLVKGLGPLTQQQQPSKKGILAPEPVDLTGMSREDIFALVDKDNSKAVDFNEFKEMLKYYKLNLSDQKCKELFAECDADSSGVIDYNEFLKTLDLLEQQVAHGSLGMLGLSVPMLVGVLISTMCVLVGLLFFILFGIQAFTENSEFGSVINSLLPMGAGAASGSREEGGDENEMTAAVTDTIDSTLTKMSSDV